MESPWLNEVDGALARGDVRALDKVYYDRAHGNCQNLYLMLKRVEAVDSINPACANYMRLLLWTCGWDYEEALAGVRNRLGFAENAGPEGVENFVIKLCETSTLPASTEA